MMGVMRAEIVNLCEIGEPGMIAVWVDDNDPEPYYLTKWEDGDDPLWAQGLAYIAEHDPTVAQQLPAAQARIAELEVSNARMRLALELLLADYCGIDRVLKGVKHRVSEQRRVGLPFECGQALVDALLNVLQNRDLEEVPDDAHSGEQ